MGAYISGLEKRLASGKEIYGISSVASFFVSRMDSKVDGYIEDKVNNGELSSNKAASVLGKTAIANAKLAYQEYLKVFESDRFRALLPKGANAQRPLWASTSTKNPSYPDTLYVDHLIGPNTVNTLPPKTLIHSMITGLLSTALRLISLVKKPHWLRWLKLAYHLLK